MIARKARARPPEELCGSVLCGKAYPRIDMSGRMSWNPPRLSKTPLRTSGKRTAEPQRVLTKPLATVLAYG